MRDYGRVYCSFWTSPDVQAMSDDARTLALYLLTSPHGTIAGVCRLPDGYVCEDLKWVPERVEKGFAELFSKGFANRCETTKWTWICKFLSWNAPENPNQWKAARRVASQIPEQCAWKACFLDVFARAAGEKAPEEPNGSGTLPKPFRNQDQDQDQEQESEGLAAGSPTTRTKTATRIPEDFLLNDERRLVAEAEKLPAERTFEKFRDYWSAASGAKARKLDWDATWRNWCRTEADRNPKPVRKHFGESADQRKARIYGHAS